MGFPTADRYWQKDVEEQVGVPVGVHVCAVHSQEYWVKRRVQNQRDRRSKHPRSAIEENLHQLTRLVISFHVCSLSLIFPRLELSLNQFRVTVEWFHYADALPRFGFRQALPAQGCNDFL